MTRTGVAYEERATSSMIRLTHSRCWKESMRKATRSGDFSVGVTLAPSRVGAWSGLPSGWGGPRVARHHRARPPVEGLEGGDENRAQLHAPGAGEARAQRDGLRRAPQLDVLEASRRE